MFEGDAAVLADRASDRQITARQSLRFQIEYEVGKQIGVLEKKEPRVSLLKQAEIDHVCQGGLAKAMGIPIPVFRHPNLTEYHVEPGIETDRPETVRLIGIDL